MPLAVHCHSMKQEVEAASIDSVHSILQLHPQNMDDIHGIDRLIVFSCVANPLAERVRVLKAKT